MALGPFEKLGKGTRVAVSAAAVLFVTLALLTIRDRLNPTEVALTLLLTVLLASTVFDSLSGLVAAILGILCFNFFFLPPFHTLNIAGPENWVAFATFVVTALIAGRLSGYAQRRADESQARQIEIERLYKELKGAFEQASEAEALRHSEKLKSSLLDAVTHDLRTPLTSIKASVTTLLDESEGPILDGESRQEFLEIIDEETDRLNEFIEGMVGIAKIEADAIHLRKRWCAAEEIIGNAIKRAKKPIGKRTVVVEIEPDLPNLYADASSVSEVIFTLIDNASKYSPPISRIRVSAKRVADDRIDISVEDQGRGIAPQMRGKIFEKFFRVLEPGIHATGSGLGLGLAIARGIVESQGGRVGVENGDEGYVTKFKIDLPIGNEERSGDPAE